MEDHIRMCRFTHNGQPETGEYTEQEDGTGVLCVMMSSTKPMR